MEQLGNLLSLGKELGYEGLELREFVQIEQDRDREERRLRREHEKEMKASEKERLELQQKIDRERLVMEKEIKEMEIRAADVSSRADRTLSSRDSGAARSCVPRLPVFEDGKTDIDAYLLRFAESQDWPVHSWPINLSALLTGVALEVYSRLSDEEARDY